MQGAVTKESTVHIDDKEFKVISIFNGTKTSSELIYGLAVKRILLENT